MGMLTKLLLVLTVIGGGAFLWLRTNAQKPEGPPPMVAVRVAAEALPIGVFLSDSTAPFAELPRDQVSAEHITREDDVALGAAVIAPIPAGRPVVRGSLLLPGQEGFLAAVLRPGRRAVSLAVNEVTSNAGHIFPGDRVDILLTQRLDPDSISKDPWREWAAETILSDVRVIAVDQNLHSDLTQRDSTGVARTITLEVLPHDAERLAVARNLGALSLTLRSLIVETADPLAQPAPPRDEPTWAGDISAAARAAARRPEEAVPVAAPPPIRMFRGSRQEEVVGP